jgi:hypothetical protein
VVNGLGGQHRLDEFNPSGHSNKLAIPSGELPDTFISEVLKVSSSKPQNRKWKTNDELDAPKF